LKSAASRAGEGFFHHHAVAIDRDDPLEFGQLARLGAQIERRDVKNRILDGNDEKIPPNDARAALIPQRDLLATLRYSD